MFELKISRNEFEDLVKKMSLPKGKNKFVFETIAPAITPNGFLEWIGRDKFAVVWVRAKGLEVSGIDEPVIIAFNAKEVLNTLKTFKIKNSRKDVIVTIIYDIANGEYIFTSVIDKHKKTTTLQAIDINEAKERRDEFPFHIGDDGIIVYKDGLKPNLHSICDSRVFRELVKNTNKIMKKNKKKPPYIYHIIFDGEKKILKTVAGEITYNSFVVEDEVYATSIKGNGIVHYADLFPEVMSAFTGDIELHTLENAPLLVVQDSDNRRLRYVVPSAKREFAT